MSLLFSTIANAETECKVEKDRAVVISTLFSQPENLYSLLWWKTPEDKVIKARSFIINGHDSVPVFSNEAEAKSQIAGSGYEKDLVEVKPGLLADILQGMEYAVLNPGGTNPVQFKTCIVKQYAEKQ